MATQAQQRILHVKVVILGDSGVGKSSIMLRFVTGNFSENYEATYGSAFMAKILKHQDVQIKYQIWDTAGQEKYHSLAHMYYRDAQVAILVYDITNLDSFSNLKKWVTELKEGGPKDMIFCVVGNKIDLQNEERVSLSEASTFAKSIGANLRLTSAKIDRGISEVFEDISKIVIARDVKDQEEKIKLESSKVVEKKKKPTCC